MTDAKQVSDSAAPEAAPVAVLEQLPTLRTSGLEHHAFTVTSYWYRSKDAVKALNEVSSSDTGEAFEVTAAAEFSIFDDYLALELPQMSLGLWVVRHVVLQASNVAENTDPSSWFKREWWSDFLEKVPYDAGITRVDERALLVADDMAEGFVVVATEAI